MTPINLVIFGIGNVGSTLLKQIEKARAQIKVEQGVDLNVPVITNSQLALFNKKPNHLNCWESDFETLSIPYNIEDIVSYVTDTNLENLVAIDATASEDFVKNYPFLIQSGFHIVAANKIANTLSYDFYKEIRVLLKKYDKQFHYETNVGAGLPVIETVKQLHQSGETITKIKGVFSGSLSYVFNRYSVEDERFSVVLKDAVKLGFTEPDAREDLSGKDVARKLLILAREIGLQKEIDSVEVESLVPKSLNGATTLSQFEGRIEELDTIFETTKNQQHKKSVLRYIGELDTQQNVLSVRLKSEPEEGDFGQLKGTDALFEVYTESYSDRPLIIKGAGAGKEVTARGVLSDVLKIANSVKTIKY